MSGETSASIFLHFLSRTSVILLAAMATGVGLCFPVGVTHFYALVSGGECTCDSTPFGEGVLFAVMGLPAALFALAAGAPVWWLVRRRRSTLAAAIAAGLSPVSAAPFSFLAFVALAYANIPIWTVFVGAVIVGETISFMVWLVPWLFTRRAQTGTDLRTRQPLIFE